ncbi:MAG TPA: hypothetical protein VHB46_09025 [Burkholderiales bacterium]|nr:hypothetical protein [Burkholderiales bacterium]
MTNDDDFVAMQGNNFVFAVEPWVLPGFKAQQTSLHHCDHDHGRDRG